MRTGCHAGALSYEWRGGFSNAELEALHAAGFGHPVTDFDWHGRLSRHSLGWVCARRGGELAGFVNVIWDGGAHAFILDTVVSPAAQRAGIGTELVAVAAARARDAGCDWLHVDFEEHLAHFYLESCGFRPTQAGLIPLRLPSCPARERAAALIERTGVSWLRSNNRSTIVGLSGRCTRVQDVFSLARAMRPGNVRGNA